MSFEDIYNHCDVWEVICSWLSGESLHLLAGVPALREATQVTPAFIFLSGLNNWGELVPWADADNVLSPRFQPLSARADRSGRPFDGWYLNEVCSRALHSTHFPRYSYQQCVGGPARPSTPCGISLPVKRQLLNRMLLPHKTCVLACQPWPANPSESCDSYSAPAFGIRPGFSYPPFWNVLAGMDSDSD
jgi:hypothetical protein